MTTLEKPPTFDPQHIVDAYAEHSDLSRWILLNTDDRTRHTVEHRQILIWLLVTMTDRPFGNVADLLGMHRSTINQRLAAVQTRLADPHIGDVYRTNLAEARRHVEGDHT